MIKNSGASEVRKFGTVFFGSGPVALKSLELIFPYIDLEAIITKPATVREMEARFPGTTVYSVENKASLNELVENHHFKSSLGILIDFGIIVSQQVIDAFPMGIINSHFSLLPEWRGADPITFAILSGQKQTGVSLMLLVAGMDEGPLLAQSALEIQPTTTTPQLTDSLIELSARMLQEIVPEYLDGHVQPQPQTTASLLGDMAPSYSRKLAKTDGKLDWQKPAKTLEREVRAFVEWPHSYTVIAGKEVIITAARAVDAVLPTSQIAVTKHTLRIGCGVGSLDIERLKPAGKKDMTAAAFLAGYGRQLFSKD